MFKTPLAATALTIVLGTAANAASCIPTHPRTGEDCVKQLTSAKGLGGNVVALYFSNICDVAIDVVYSSAEKANERDTIRPQQVSQRVQCYPYCNNASWEAVCPRHY